MISQKLLKSPALRSAVKKFVTENHDIFDVVLYGSYVRGKEDARDIDVAIILQKTADLNKKLSLAQALKENLEKRLFPFQIDVKTVDREDLLDEHFLARQGIIAEGYAIIQQENIAQLLGFKTFVLVKYSFKTLTPSQKKMFYYALKGRRGMKGVLEEMQGELLSKGLLRIPIHYEYQIEQLLTLHNVHFTTERVMSYMKRAEYS